MLGTPQQNGIVKRRNCILMDMVKSMLSYFFILIFVDACLENRHVFIKQGF